MASERQIRVGNVPIGGGAPVVVQSMTLTMTHDVEATTAQIAALASGGRDVGFVYAHGRVLKKVSSDILIDELFHEIDRWIEGGMHRPKRLKMAKPAALAMAEASLIPLDTSPSERV